MQNIIYIRTSTEKQTPEIQIKDIATLSPCKDSIIIKEQESAWAENTLRPQFDKLRALVSKGKIKTLYVWHLDRLYRNRKRLVEFLALCRLMNVKVISFQQKWLNDIQQLPMPWNEIVYDMMLQVIGWMAEDESTTKSNRIKMAVVKNGEKPAISYQGKKWGRKPFPKQTVNRVLALHGKGKSIREIAKEIFVYDKNNNSRPISKSAVHKLIVQNST